jgi:hypothetical protein
MFLFEQSDVRTCRTWGGGHFANLCFYDRHT